VWTENFSGMDLNKKEVWTSIGPLNHAFTQQLFALAEGYGIKVWLRFDASVVKGLAYYTRTVF